MKKMLFAVLPALILAGVAFAIEIDVSGAWTMVTQSPRGERSNDLKIVQQGEKLTVTIQSPRGEQAYAGIIKGSAVIWSGKRRRPDGVEVTVTFSGKLEGEVLKGVMQMGDRGRFDWSAARVKPVVK